MVSIPPQMFERSSYRGGGELESKEVGCVLSRVDIVTEICRLIRKELWGETRGRTVNTPEHCGTVRLSSSHTTKTELYVYTEFCLRYNILMGYALDLTLSLWADWAVVSKGKKVKLSL
jgi:hypothetical protein